MGVAVLTGALVLGGAGVANAHGWVGAEGSDLVARQVMPGNTGLGSAQYDKQSLEGPKGFPETGPVDGQLASVNKKFGPNLDEQSPTRWVKNKVKAGPVHVNWTFTAPHKTTDWKYFITKIGWDQNAPLTRTELEPLATIKHDGSEASNHPNQVIDVPADHHGYHVIYAVWNVADTGNAFYNTIDVDIEGAVAPDTQAPTVPAGIGRVECDANIGVAAMDCVNG